MQLVAGFADSMRSSGPRSDLDSTTHSSFSEALSTFCHVQYVCSPIFVFLSSSLSDVGQFFRLQLPAFAALLDRLPRVISG